MSADPRVSTAIPHYRMGNGAELRSAATAPRPNCRRADGKRYRTSAFTPENGHEADGPRVRIMHRPIRRALTRRPLESCPITDRLHGRQVKDGPSMTAVAANVVKDLAPTGRLRASINLGNIVLAQTDPKTGAPAGVTPELARSLGQSLGVPVDLVTF